MRHSERPICRRCELRSGPGHVCRQRIKLTKNTGILILRFLDSKRHYSFHWSWRGDRHEFHWRPSLGDHVNVSHRIRLERMGDEMGG